MWHCSSASNMMCEMLFRIQQVVKVLLGDVAPLVYEVIQVLSLRVVNEVVKALLKVMEVLKVLQAVSPPSPTHPGPFVRVSQSQFFRDVVNIWR